MFINFSVLNVFFFHVWWFVACLRFVVFVFCFFLGILFIWSAETLWPGHIIVRYWIIRSPQEMHVYFPKGCQPSQGSPLLEYQFFPHFLPFVLNHSSSSWTARSCCRPFLRRRPSGDLPRAYMSVMFSLCWPSFFLLQLLKFSGNIFLVPGFPPKP